MRLIRMIALRRTLRRLEKRGLVTRRNGEWTASLEGRQLVKRIEATTSGVRRVPRSEVLKMVESISAPQAIYEMPAVPLKFIGHDDTESE